MKYKDISVLKAAPECQSESKDEDAIAIELRKEARRLFNSHKEPATLSEWEVKRKKITVSIIEKAGIEFYPNLPLSIHVTNSISFPQYNVQSIYFQTMPGVYSTASIYIPKGEGPYPAIVNTHGHIEHARRAKSVQERAHLLAQNGFVCICMDAFGSGERSEIHNHSDYHGGNMGAALLNFGKSLLGVQVTENIRCVDLLCSLPMVNPHLIGATGESGGGNQAMWLAAIDERIKACMPVVSVGTFEAYIMAHNCVCELLPEGLMIAEESQVLGLIAPRALSVCSALQEKHSAFSPTEMLRTVKNTGKIFKLYKASEKFHVQIFNNEHEFSQSMQVAMVQWFISQLKESVNFPQTHGYPTSLPVEQLLTFSDIVRSPSVITQPEYLLSLSTEYNPTHTENATEERTLLSKLIGVDPKIIFSTNQLKRVQENNKHVLVLINTSTSSADITPDIPHHTIPLWGTDIHKAPTAFYFDDQMVPFHTLSRSLLWLGKTVQGVWVQQINQFINDIEHTKAEHELVIHAHKEAAIAALAFAAITKKRMHLYLYNAPITYAHHANTKYTNYFSMAVHIPKIFTWGDMVKIAALSNAEITIYNPRNIQGEKIKPEQIQSWQSLFKKYQEAYHTSGSVSFHIS
ncbi:alpha/beta hydrolase family protein [Phnomibacter ginsenosidimutans]|uniref:Acetyl xylan esterase domain-containing protein n=1 Tax=Phnomibacter ginsenosidimutans TaxID=2676868 RepID=A0A6I6GI84_9BACT|nr:acetylxylan esterase [Phnomibacter ginsenosidimutans]QGW27418.1 hypothetical protein GLV81_04285 [Phnomibacter ginsenosidimutans]